MRIRQSPLLTIYPLNGIIWIYRKGRLHYMRTLIYREDIKNVSYRLFSRNLKHNNYIYDIEVETITNSHRLVESIPAVSMDCQTALLLVEMLIRKDIKPQAIVQSYESLEYCL